MTEILFLLSALTLLSYGCNRDHEQSVGGGTGMEKQQQMENAGEGTMSSPDSSMGSQPEATPSNSDMDSDLNSETQQ